MTREKLNEIRARCEVATPAPWIYDERVGCVAVYHGKKVNCMGESDGRRIYYANGYKKIDDRGKWEWTVDDKDCDNAKFIAHARQDIPELLDYITELEAKLEKAVVLPCKVGDTVYRIDIDPNMVDSNIESYIVKSFTVCDDGEVLLRYNSYGGTICTADCLTNKTPYLVYYLCFLSREEAEKALKGRG